MLAHPRTLPGVESRDLKSYVHFGTQGIVRETVFETEHLWSQVLCFERNQKLGPVADPSSDAMFTIVAGEAVFLVNRRRKRLKQWGSVLVPAGSAVTVTNASTEPLVMLLVASPPPASDTAVPGAGRESGI